MQRSQQLEQLVLHQVGILELIHQYMLKAAGVALAHLGVIHQQAHGFEQQVIEIDCVGIAQQHLIALVDAPGDLVAVRLGGKILRGDQVVLGGRDGSVNAGRAVEFFVQVQFADGALDQGLLVIAVHDDEVVVKGQVLCLAAQNARTIGMESAQPDALAALGKQVLQAVLHLAGGFVGERDRQDVVGLYAHCVDQVGDALGQDARFTGAGSCQHQRLTQPGGDGGTLLRVEKVEVDHGRGIVPRRQPGEPPCATFHSFSPPARAFEPVP